MSVFYDLASLVLVPSGYKAEKVYAQKPLTNDGQLTFSRASTATRVNASGLIETVASNVPRLDYTNSTCPKLLLEPSRTNAALHSSDFDQWSDGLGCDIFANTAVSPDGTTNADTLSFGANADSRAFRSVSFSSGTWTFSVYAKSSTGKKFRFRISDASGTQYSSDQTTTSTWQRFSYQFTGAPTAIALTNEAAATAGSIDVYGFQGELGDYPTSLIPTTTAAVTRLADAASKTGISSLIGQTEGTLFIDYNFTNSSNTLDSTPIRILGSGSASVYFEMNTNETLEVVVVNSAGTLIFNSTSPTQSLGPIKVAVAYKDSDFAYYINGTQIAVQTSGAFASASFTSLNLGAYSSGVQILSDSVSQALLFKTRLTNAQLAELTSL
jgi:hypothetical protein